MTTIKRSPNWLRFAFIAILILCINFNLVMIANAGQVWYSAASNLPMQSNTGVNESDGGRYSAPGQNAAGYVTYGPYITTLTAGTYQVTWRLMTGDNTSNANLQYRIEVCDTTAGQEILASQNLYGTSWGSAWANQNFVLNFNLPSSRVGHQLEFRTYWYGQVWNRIQYISVDTGSATPAPTATFTPTAPPVQTTKRGNITIHAAGTNYNGWPLMEVKLNGSVIKTFTVSQPFAGASGEWGTYVVPGDLFGTGNTVELRFTNDAYGGTETTDRNLFVKDVAVAGIIYLATGASFPDGCSIFDNGIAYLPCNGTIRFTNVGGLTAGQLPRFLWSDAADCTIPDYPPLPEGEYVGQNICKVHVGGDTTTLAEVKYHFDYAANAGYKVILVGGANTDQAYKNHISLLLDPSSGIVNNGNYWGWFVEDEPDKKGISVATFSEVNAFIKSLDNTHPTIATLGSIDAFTMPWRAYVGITDITSINYYPRLTTEICSTFQTNFTAYTNNIKALVDVWKSAPRGNKILGVTLQLTMQRYCLFGSTPNYVQPLTKNDIMNMWTIARDVNNGGSSDFQFVMYYNWKHYSSKQTTLCNNDIGSTAATPPVGANFTTCLLTPVSVPSNSPHYPTGAELRTWARDFANTYGNTPNLKYPVP